MKRMSGELATHTPPCPTAMPRGDVQPFGEDGDLVGLAVAVGVFEDLDAVLARRRRSRRGYSRLSVIQTRPALVERHRHRVDDVRLGGDQLDREALRHGHLLDRLFRRERRAGRLVLGVGDDLAVLGLGGGNDEGQDERGDGAADDAKSHYVASVCVG